jgi:hypothetical protein
MARTGNPELGSPLLCGSRYNVEFRHYQTATEDGRYRLK